MLERAGLPLWGWAVGAVLVIAVILLAYRAVEAERQLQAAQREIDNAMVALRQTPTLPTGSPDPETDLARALLSRGMTGQAQHV